MTTPTPATTPSTLTGFPMGQFLNALAASQRGLGVPAECEQALNDWRDAKLRAALAAGTAGEANAEPPWKASYFSMRTERDAADARVKELEAEVAREKERANLHGNDWERQLRRADAAERALAEATKKIDDIAKQRLRDADAYSSRTDEAIRLRSERDELKAQLAALAHPATKEEKQPRSTLIKELWRDRDAWAEQARLVATEAAHAQVKISSLERERDALAMQVDSLRRESQTWKNQALKASEELDAANAKLTSSEPRYFTGDDQCAAFVKLNPRGLVKAGWVPRRVKQECDCPSCTAALDKSLESWFSERESAKAGA